MHALAAWLAPSEVVFGGLKPTLLYFYGRANRCPKPPQIVMKKDVLDRTNTML